LQVKSVHEPAARAQLAAALRELGRDDAEHTLARLQRLVAVDAHFHSLLAHDQAPFLAKAGAEAEAERDFASGVQRACLEAANAYQAFLRHRASWATSREALDVMFRVTGLALHAIHAFVKWGYLAGESGRVVPWKQLHALYALAEDDGYAQVPFVLFASHPAAISSVQAMYLRTLLLDLLHTGSLTRMQIEIADGWLAAWCNDYSLDVEYASRHHFLGVDLASTSGLHPVRQDRHGESLRYLRADSLKAQVEDAQAGLRQGRPHESTGAQFPMAEHVALLAVVEKLCRSVLAGSENRQEERTRLDDREADVVVGFPRLLERLHGDPGEESVGRWRVQDLSRSGFGLVVERPAAEAVPLNGIVGLRNQAHGGWIACAVVRKLANRVRGEMVVGLEVLSYRPVPVDLVPADGTEPSRAVYLPGTEADGRDDALLVQAHDFASGSTFSVYAGGATWRVRMNRIVRKGSGWIKARFEIESKA
jgi:hypothetical protein